LRRQVERLSGENDTLRRRIERLDEQVMRLTEYYGTSAAVKPRGHGWRYRRRAGRTAMPVRAAEVGPD